MQVQWCPLLWLLHSDFGDLANNINNVLFYNYDVFAIGAHTTGLPKKKKKKKQKENPMRSQQTNWLTEKTRVCQVTKKTTAEGNTDMELFNTANTLF